MKLAFQGNNFHNAYDLDHDGMLDIVTTPYDAEVNLSTIDSCEERSNHGKHQEIFRLEKMFKVNIIGVCSSWLEQGRVKCLLECQNALGNYSEMETDLSEEARYSLPFLWDGSKQKESAWDAWVGGGYKSEDWLENLFAFREAQKITARRSKIITPEERGETCLCVGLGNALLVTAVDEHKAQNTPSKETKDVLTDGGVVADEIHCAICSRELTNPTSRRLQIGPECRKRIGLKGLLYLQDDNVVSAELMEALKLYHEEPFRKWIIRACLTLDAPLPTKVLNWLGNEWFGYRNAPILYYLSADGQLNRLDTYKRNLRHKVITQKTAETELDSHAIRIASETVEESELAFKERENGNGNGGRKPSWSTTEGRRLQMDKKLNTLLIEAEGTKKAISCREIATQYDSYEKGIIKRLRAGIDSGADISTVELN